MVKYYRAPTRLVLIPLVYSCASVLVEVILTGNFKDWMGKIGTVQISSRYKCLYTSTRIENRPKYWENPASQRSGVQVCDATNEAIKV